MWTLVLALGVSGAAPGLPAGPPGLELRLESARDTCVAYTPFIVTYSITNNSRGPIIVSGGLGREVGFEIAGADKTFVPYATGPEALTFRTERVMAAGERYVFERAILTSSLGKFAQANPGNYPGTTPFPLATPGKHYVRASLFLGEGKEPVSSNVLEVTVIPPKDEVVLDYFPSLEDYGAAAGGDYTVRDVSEAMARWASFVRAHPKSVYAPQVAYHLGRRALYGLGDRGANPITSIEMFQIALKGSPPGYVDNCMLGLAEGQVEAGRFTEAAATIEHLLQAYPSSDVVGLAQRIRSGLRQGDRSLRKIYSH